MNIHLLKSKTEFIISLWHSTDFSNYNGLGVRNPDFTPQFCLSQGLGPGIDSRLVL